jgi:hypothetical protein
MPSLPHGLELRVIALALTCAALLSACGGGGDGGGGSPPAPTPPPSGTFTIGATSATFTTLQGDTPPQKTITMTVTGTSGVAGVGAAFPASQGVPNWLLVGITGTMPNFTVTLNIIGAPTPGHYTATLLLGTGNANGTVLQSKEVAVTLDVAAPIGLSSSPQVATSFIFGHATASGQIQVNVAATGASWRVLSNVPWIAVPAGTLAGSQNLNLTIDASTLAIGTHNGRVTVENTAFPTNTVTVDLTANVVAPTLTVTTTDIVLGGADGLSATPQPFTATLNTGAASYPWAVVLTENQQLGWLSSAAPTGTVSGTQNASVNLSFDRTKVTPGVYTGTARFDVNVKGVNFSASAPVTLNVESHRLYPEYDGIALSSFPTRSRLTRAIKVLSSRDRANVPWTATDDQPWLTVTPSGVTGGTLTLTADPNLVPSMNESHIAMVTLASTDPTIERTEKVRVGIWVGSSDPLVHTTTPALPGQGSRALVVNPVEPFVYTVSFSGTLPFDSDAIRVFNAYTGAQVGAAIDLPGTEISSLGVSSDGRLLFALDHTSETVFVINAATGAPITTYDSSFSTGAPHGFLSVRPNGHPVIWTPAGDVFDSETHERIAMTVDGTVATATNFPALRSASVDSKRVIAANPSGSRSVWIIDQYFTVLGGKKLEFERVYFTPNDPLSHAPWDLALTSSGERVFINNDALTDLGGAYSVGDTALTALPNFPVGPVTRDIQAIESTWDGRVFYSVNIFDPGSTDANVFIFDNLGNPGGSFRSGPHDGARARAQFGFTGDLLRVISTQTIIPLTTPAEHILTFDEVP